MREGDQALYKDLMVLQAVEMDCCEKDTHSQEQTAKESSTDIDEEVRTPTSVGKEDNDDASKEEVPSFQKYNSEEYFFS